MLLWKISFSSSSNARQPFSILKENKTLYLESANGRCSVKKMFFFVTSPWSVHWLTCFARKGYSHKDFFFPQIILPEMRTEVILSLRNSAVFYDKWSQNWYSLQDTQLFDRTPQGTGTTIGSYLLRILKKVTFSQEASKNLKGTPCYPSKICKSLSEYLILSFILPGCLSLSSSRLYSRTHQYPLKST